MNAELLRRYLEFYQDLGIKTLYKQQAAFETSKAPQPLPALAPSGDSLVQIRADIGDCRRCRLCESRSKIVFGVGNEKSPLVFVGEGPGAEEDAQGIPFV